MTKLTPEACRAGRAILKWSVRELATKAGTSPSTIHLAEKGNPIRELTEKKILAAFSEASVEVISGNGTGARLVHRPKTRTAG